MNVSDVSGISWPAPAGRNAPVTGWRKSSRSGGGSSACVEVGQAGLAIGVRDSRDAHGPILMFEAAVWRRFAANIRALPE
jgi:hypothetical protein